jgi:TM2 domain-containing membrane protein YozV
MMNPSSDTSNKKIAAGICGISLGAFGVHKFILGYTQEGLIMLFTLLIGGFATFGLTSLIVVIIGLIEGIIYLTKSDMEFEAIYLTNQKRWF